jgi:LacI family transcriptional regulator
LPRVLIDPIKGINAAVSHLAQLGHKNIVYVSGPAASWSNQQRQQAVEKACAKQKLRLRSLPTGHPDFEAGRESTEKILALKSVTAVITFDDSVAHGLLAGLAQRGVDVPRTLSVIGCDDVLGASTYPALTSVSARCDEAGRMASDLLLRALNEEHRSDARSILDTWLVARGTTGPVRA